MALQQQPGALTCGGEGVESEAVAAASGQAGCRAVTLSLAAEAGEGGARAAGHKCWAHGTKHDGRLNAGRGGQG